MVTRHGSQKRRERRLVSNRIGLSCRGRSCNFRVDATSTRCDSDSVWIWREDCSAPRSGKRTGDGNTTTSPEQLYFPLDRLFRKDCGPISGTEWTWKRDIIDIHAWTGKGYLR
jgi:hypothetical protein